jgi:hypothetical protein
VVGPEHLREYASHLFALAITARENGDADYANKLAVRATEYLYQAAAIENPPAMQRLPKKE